MENLDCNINSEIKHDSQLLKFAVKRGNIEMIKQLVENQHADINIEYNSPLCLALEQCNIHFAKWLIDHGADVNLRLNPIIPKFYGQRPYMFPPLFYAIQANSSYLIKLLLERGADVNATDYLSDNVLHFLIKCIDKKIIERNLEILNILIEAGADLEARNKKGKTPLEFANQRFADQTFAKVLIANGAIRSEFDKDQIFKVDENADKVKTREAEIEEMKRWKLSPECRSTLYDVLTKPSSFMVNVFYFNESVRQELRELFVGGFLVFREALGYHIKKLLNRVDLLEKARSVFVNEVYVLPVELCLRIFQYLTDSNLRTFLWTYKKKEY